ncbi:MAG: pyridoxamine 5'-phosphate oxidase family protein [Halobacteriaceae archaeon]
MGTVPDPVERRLRGAALIAHLATCGDGRPHVAPVWYGYPEADVLEVLTTGRKLANIRTNPRVAVSIQRDTDGEAEWYVVLRGTAEVIEDDAAIREAAAYINPKYDAPADAWAENTLVRIEIGSVSHGAY